MSTAIPQHSSESNEHYTPSAIIEVCRETMGGIDLDPASCKLANHELVHATTYLTKEDDGLRCQWHGRIFCNPPGGKYRVINGKLTPVISKGPGDSSAATWFYKAVMEWKLGRAEAVCFLGFTLELLRITQARPPCAAQFPFCLLKDRTDFLRDNNSKLVPQGQPTHANVLVCITNHPAIIARFEKYASALGVVVVPQKMVAR
jgi:hypothetical protein